MIDKKDHLMKPMLATLAALTVLAASPLAAQATHSAQSAKPSMMSRIKAATQSHKPSAAPVSKPSVATKKTAQVPRTAKSLACSTQADKQGVHGKARKSFMSHCKKS